MEISSFQELMRSTYLQGDRARGVEATLTWLEGEVAELREALKRREATAIAGEMADILAWLASLANLLAIDLEEAALRKYGLGCPRCGCTPCRCLFRAADDRH